MCMEKNLFSLNVDFTLWVFDVSKWKRVNFFTKIALGISNQSTFNHFLSAAVKFTPGECRCNLPTAKRCYNVWKNYVTASACKWFSDFWKIIWNATKLDLFSNRRDWISLLFNWFVSVVCICLQIFDCCFGTNLIQHIFFRYEIVQIEHWVVHYLSIRKLSCTKIMFISKNWKRWNSVFRISQF